MSELKALTNRNVILWDFDGVLYSYHSVDREEMKRNFWAANAEGARSILTFLSEEEAYRIGGEGFLKYHDTISGFLPYALQIGMDENDFKSAILAAQLKCSFRNIKNNLPELIAPCDDTNRLFEKLQPYFKHILLTHAHRDNWAIPVAENLGVRDYFDEIFGYEELDFQNKGQNSFAIEKGLKAANACANQAIFIEDQLRHLEVAKTDYPDLLTVFIEGAEWIDPPDYVDLVVKRPKHFLEHLVAQYCGETKVA